MGFKNHDAETIIQKGKVDCGWSSQEWQKITGIIKQHKSPKQRKQSFRIKLKSKAQNLTIELSDSEWNNDDQNKKHVSRNTVKTIDMPTSVAFKKD